MSSRRDNNVRIPTSWSTGVEVGLIDETDPYKTEYKSLLGRIGALAEQYEGTTSRTKRGKLKSEFEALFRAEKDESESSSAEEYTSSVKTANPPRVTRKQPVVDRPSARSNQTSKKGGHTVIESDSSPSPRLSANRNRTVSERSPPPAHRRHSPVRHRESVPSRAEGGRRAENRHRVGRIEPSRRRSDSGEEEEEEEEPEKIRSEVSKSSFRKEKRASPGVKRPVVRAMPHPQTSSVEKPKVFEREHSELESLWRESVTPSLTDTKFNKTFYSFITPSELKAVLSAIKTGVITKEEAAEKFDAEVKSFIPGRTLAYNYLTPRPPRRQPDNQPSYNFVSDEKAWEEAVKIGFLDKDTKFDPKRSKKIISTAELMAYCVVFKETPDYNVKEYLRRDVYERILAASQNPLKQGTGPSDLIEMAKSMKVWTDQVDRHNTKIIGPGKFISFSDMRNFIDTAKMLPLVDAYNRKKLFLWCLSLYLKGKRSIKENTDFDFEGTDEERAAKESQIRMAAAIEKENHPEEEDQGEDQEPDQDQEEQEEQDAAADKGEPPVEE